MDRLKPTLVHPAIGVARRGRGAGRVRRCLDGSDARADAAARHHAAAQRGGGCGEGQGVYRTKSLSTAAPQPLPIAPPPTDALLVTADAAGRLWIVIGTDSGFEGRTEIYFLNGVATGPHAPAGRLVDVTAVPRLRLRRSSGGAGAGAARLGRLARLQEPRDSDDLDFDDMSYPFFVIASAAKQFSFVATEAFRPGLPRRCAPRNDE